LFKVQDFFQVFVCHGQVSAIEAKVVNQQ